MNIVQKSRLILTSGTIMGVIGGAVYLSWPIPLAHVAMNTSSGVLSTLIVTAFPNSYSKCSNLIYEWQHKVYRKNEPKIAKQHGYDENQMAWISYFASLNAKEDSIALAFLIYVVVLFFIIRYIIFSVYKYYNKKCEE